jgi:hypothetical protein
VAAAGRRRHATAVRALEEVLKDIAPKIEVRVLSRLTLLWVVKRGGGFHEALEAAGGVALEASADFGVGFLFGDG